MKWRYASRRLLSALSVSSPGGQISSGIGPDRDHTDGWDRRQLQAQEVRRIYTFEIDPDRVVRCDDGVRALFGLSPSERLDCEAWSTHLHAEDRAQAQAWLDGLWRQDGAIEVEFRTLLPDGSVRWLLSRAETAAARGGNPEVVFGMIMDITDRKANETRLRMALESTTDSVHTLSPDWRFTFLNRRASDHLAMGRDLLGLVVWDAFPEIVGGPLWHAYRRCMEKREPVEAEYLCNRLGRLFFVRAFPSEDGGITVFFRDVTEERQAAERDAQLAAIVASSTDAMISRDALDGRVRSWNHAAEQLFGYTEAEALNSPLDLLIPPELTDDLFYGALQGERIQEYETLRMTKDGHRIPVAITATRMSGRDGRVIGVSAIYRDIRRRKAAEAALARHHAELERLVEERTRDLQRAQVRLAQAEKLAALGELAGGIAHDFNNLLQAVQGSTELLDELAEQPAQVHHFARLVKEAAERGAAITRRLLTFARRADLRAEPLSAKSLLEEMREVLAHTLGGRIAVQVEAAATLPLLLADKGQLETVLVNLTANARDAMPEGGTVTLSAAATTVVQPAGAGDVLARLAPGHYVCIAVSDTGMGMTPDVLARVSEPFFTTKPKGKGTGLGLAMARGFAEQSGGTLEFESAPGHGTTVRLWFPVAEGTASAAPLRRVASASAAGKPHVLLVDDETVLREIISEQLQGAGYAVQAVPDATEALDLLQAGEAVDVLVTDLSMSGMDGLKLIRAAQQVRPGLPSILLTGYAEEAAVLVADQMAGRAFSLLHKPVSGAHLTDRIAALLSPAPSERCRVEPSHAIIR